MFNVNAVVADYIYYNLFDFIDIALGLFVFGCCYYTLNRSVLAHYSSKAPSKRVIFRLMGMVYKYSVKLLVLLIISYIIYSKNHNLIQVTQPVSSIAGLKQRIAIIEKLDKYQDQIPMYQEFTKFRSGGFLNNVIYWDIKPTYSEMNYLREYILKIFTTYEYLLKSNKVCSSKKYPETSSMFVKRKWVLLNSKVIELFILKLNPNEKKDLELLNNTDLLINQALENYFKCDDHVIIPNHK